MPAIGVTQPIMDRSFRELFVRNPLPMWLYDKDTLRFVEVNEAAVQQYGYSREEFLGMTLAEIRPKDDLPRMHTYLRRLHSETPRPGFHRSPGWRHLRKDGTLVWVDSYSHDFHYGEHLVRLVQVHDVTALKLAADRLAEQSAFFSQLFHNSPEAIVMLDEHDVVVDANASFENLFLYTLDEIKGRAINDLIVPPEHADEATDLSRSVFDKSSAQRDTVRQRKDGSLVDVSALGYPITLGSRQVGVFAIYRDITESKRLASELAFHTSHDPLTGLINRHEFERRAKARMQWGARSRVGHAMLYMDLDQFKVINDSCGHAAGDGLLV